MGQKRTTCNLFFLSFLANISQVRCLCFFIISKAYESAKVYELAFLHAKSCSANGYHDWDAIKF
jgi:hypothetical protein